MKNLVAVAAVLALALAGQCFAEDIDSKHDCKEAGGHMNSSGQCVDKDGVVLASPAAAAAAGAGALSAGAVAGVAAVIAVAVAVAVTSGGGNENNNNTGTTGTTGTH